jgi:hypothetical protein
MSEWRDTERPPENCGKWPNALLRLRFALSYSTSPNASSAWLHTSVTRSRPYLVFTSSAGDFMQRILRIVRGPTARCINRNEPPAQSGSPTLRFQSVSFGIKLTGDFLKFWRNIRC